MEMIKKIINVEITKSDISELENSLTAVVSTEDRDRDNEIIRLGGMNLDNYRKAGMPLLYQHRPEWLLGKGLWIKVSEKKLIGKWRFHMKNDLSRETYSLLKDGYLKQFSVGFISKDLTKSGVHLKTELLETSIVTLASNVNTDVLETKVHNPILRKELQLNLESFDYLKNSKTLSQDRLQGMARDAVTEAFEKLSGRKRNASFELASNGEIGVDPVMLKELVDTQFRIACKGVDFRKLMEEKIDDAIKLKLDKMRGRVY